MTDPTGQGGAALLVLDMINPMTFAGAAALLPAATAAAEAIARLRDEADAAGVPTIYVNDNHGDWTHDRVALIAAVQAQDCPGRPLVDRLGPRDDDYFVIKPQFSGFYATTLPALLPRLGVSRLILTGIAADICVLFTAADAHMREYELWAPADAVAGEDADRTRWALAVMASAMGAETKPTARLRLRDWRASGRP